MAGKLARINRSTCEEAKSCERPPSRLLGSTRCRLRRGAVDKADGSERFRRMEAAIRWVDRRPGTILPIGLAPCTVQIQPPAVAFNRRSVGGILRKIAERNGQLDDPVVVSLGLVLFFLSAIRRPIP